MHLYRIEQKMSQTATRRTTREKKPSRQYWYDEQDYSNIAGSKPHDTKEKPNTAQENNALAKILTKFINSSNLKYRELMENLPTNTQNEPPQEAENPKITSYGGGPARGIKVYNKPPKCRPPKIDIFNGDRGGHSDGLNGSKPPRSTTQFTPALGEDISYHITLNEHVRNAYPNINSISSDMLRDLSIPTQLLSKPPLPKPKVDKKIAKPPKDENKPFKRQSYHVAIAYHIHLKQVKNTKTVEYVDPTYPARRLKEEEAKKV